MSVLYALTAGCLLVVVIQWARTLRTYRNIPLILIERTIFLALRTARRSLIAFGICTVISVFAVDFLTGSIPVPLGFVVTVVLVPLGYAALPPTILFLGASRREIKPLLREIQRSIALFGIIPLRVSHLLDAVPGATVSSRRACSGRRSWPS